MTGSIFTANTRPDELWPGLKGFWDGATADYEGIKVYDKIFTIVRSDKDFEKYEEHRNTGLVPVKPEGAQTQFDGFAQGIRPELRNTAYSLGIILTHESIVDNKYFTQGKDKVRALRKSFFTTKEKVHANILNRAENASYTVSGGDGQSLLSVSHTNARGTWANKQATDADLSETALEDMLILIANTVDASGVHNAGLSAKTVVVPTNNMFEIERILGSVLQNDTGNNAVNAIKSMNAIPNGYIYWRYLTDTDSWFVITDAEKGLISQQREDLEFYDDNEKRTRNMQYFGYERYVASWVDPRGVFGSLGA
jgi:hypothetical protein